MWYIQTTTNIDLQGFQNLPGQEITDTTLKGLDKFEPNCYYHIVNHAVGSENLFRSNSNYQYFLKKYAHHMSSVCHTLSYCLMPNHIHILIRTLDEKETEAHQKFKGDYHRFVMQPLSNLLNAYAKAYNKMYDRKGALWIDYTKRFKIDADSYLTATINYIHQNPVKHGFAQDIGDWPHSSYHSHLSSKPTLLSRHEVISWFGNIEAYVDFHITESNRLVEGWEF